MIMRGFRWGRFDLCPSGNIGGLASTYVSSGALSPVSHTRRFLDQFSLD